MKVWTCSNWDELAAIYASLELAKQHWNGQGYNEPIEWEFDGSRYEAGSCLIESYEVIDK